jgi:pyridoxal phosphate enzyme (YggS family)
LQQPTPDTIRERYELVLGQVADAASKAGRDPASARVVVVTKGHTLETLRAALDAGITDIAENYAEEAVEKILVLAAAPSIHWHMIGHVQSRKAELVAKYFDMLHSLDSRKLAGRLDRFSGQAGRSLPVLLECNMSGEASKFGYPAWDESQWSALAAEANALRELPHLAVRGLMTMPPYPDHPEQSRPYFRRLRVLREYLQAKVPAIRWDELSMGTSDDFGVAAEEGATLIRVGTAILGPRP